MATTLAMPSSPEPEERLLTPHYFSEKTRTSNDTDELESQRHHLSPSSTTTSSSTPLKAPPGNLKLWILLNLTATIGIVFTNKHIFSDPLFHDAQLTFASFHFFVTFLTLHLLSSRRIGLFDRRRARLLDILPLAGAMCLNVILPNFSLAYSSVTFYQTARVLLTPVVAVLNWMIYRVTIPRQAAYTLIPVCLGVAMLVYYDVQPTPSSSVTSTYAARFASFRLRFPSSSSASSATVVATPAAMTRTSTAGVIFALTGVLASSVYTIWISAFHKRLEMSSIQLLHNQSLVGGVLLLYLIPFIDTLPVLSEIGRGHWGAILLSAACACAINLSQFVIITGCGPVASTVVGHTKTICIVALGWVVSGRRVGDRSIVGVVVAVGGIVLYSYMIRIYGDRKPV